VGGITRSALLRVVLGTLGWFILGVVGLGGVGFGPLHAPCVNTTGECSYPPDRLNLAGYALIAIAVVGFVLTIAWAVRRVRAPGGGGH
jgi:hypothetical protein